MRAYTVVGYWPDTDQRFTARLSATTATEAESRCIEENPGVSVCAVFAGEHDAVDTDPYVRHSDA